MAMSFSFLVVVGKTHERSEGHGKQAKGTCGEMSVAEKLLLRFRHFRLPWRSLGVLMVLNC
jgi:hypothetical protein